MSSRRSIESPPAEQVVVHYHYHYYLDSPNPQPQYQEGLRRIKSDHKHILPNHDSKYAETESLSSHRSWKRLVRPELQTKTGTAARSSENLSFLSPNDKFRKPYSQAALRATVSGFQLHTPKNPENKERSLSTMFPHSPEQSYRSGNAEEHTPFRAADPGRQNMQTNLALRKSRFCKKRQIQILNADRLRQLTEREAHRQEGRGYRWMLLEEECNYLREQFLQHLQREHPEGRQ